MCRLTLSTGGNLESLADVVGQAEATEHEEAACDGSQAGEEAGEGQGKNDWRGQSEEGLVLSASSSAACALDRYAASS